MLIRYYSEADFQAVKALHAKQGLEYTLPDLESPTMLVRSVIEESGEVTHAAFLRKTAEAYWIFDPAEQRRATLGRLLALHRELLIPAQRNGLEDLHCWIPPQLAQDKVFDRTMLNLGWKRPEWTSYSYELNRTKHNG